MAFAHLHLHTEYSLLDGACRIKPLVNRLKELGFAHCAVTDHGVMYGAVDFYSACKDAGIHPVIGCEVYVCPDRFDKQSVSREYSHLILLCENQEGYRNLTKLVSAGFTEGFYYRPRIDYGLLRQHHEGLIGLSACLSGDLPKLILQGRLEEAKAYALEMEGLFGKGSFFIELMDHGIQEQALVLKGLVNVSKATGVPLVVTNDCHYLLRQDAQAQEVLMCIQTGKTLQDETRMRMDTEELYVKSEEEMRRLFPEYGDAIERTAEIAARCRVEFDFDSIYLPKYPVPTGESSLEMLTRLCREGLAKRYPGQAEDPDSEPRKRLDYELEMIARMGYVDYFLITWDFIDYAKRQGIMVGPGRGSGAGSIVAYTLSITTLDPLQYNLLFERFLNPERMSMPDLDIDFCYERRQEVIDYVARKYGHDHVAQIITFGTMKAKAVVRDVGRVLGMSYASVDQVAKAIPFALDMTLQKALELSPQLQAMVATDPQVQRLFEMSLTLEGMPRHASTHAAGVLITARPVTDYVPLQLNDEVITTQYTMGTLEKLGLLKMDFLGLRTLTVIRDTLDALAQRGIALKEEDIPLDDPQVYQMISAGDTDGVFQLESSGMRIFLQNMKPSCFEDIIAAISLYRPGPMESIPRYIQGKNDPATTHYETPLLKPILDVTYGCMVYQEQVMQIVRDLAGYSLGRSDLMRRAMSKKKKDVMAKERAYFVHGMVDEKGNQIIDGAVRRGVPEAVAEKIFDDMSAFASYAFNKSHAAAYGVLAVQTGWLKRHYPVEFMASTMNSMMDSLGKVAEYIQYCKSKDIPVLPPDVNGSGWRFTVGQDAKGRPSIRFGLGGVKNVGQHAVESILQERQNGPYKSLFDFVRRNASEALNKRTLESLIKAGAFDSLGLNRAQLLSVYERAMEDSAQKRKANIAGQVSLFDMGMGLGGGGDRDMEAPPIPEHPLKVLLSMEKEMTGVYISGHPLDEVAQVLQSGFTTAQDVAALAEAEDHGMAYDGSLVTMAGILAACKGKITKKGAMMGFVTLEDLTGQTEGLVFPKVYERYVPLLMADNIVCLTGKLSFREDEEPKLLVDTVQMLTPESKALARPLAPALEEDPEVLESDLRWEEDPAWQEGLRVPARFAPAAAPVNGKAALANGKAIPANGKAAPAARAPGPAQAAPRLTDAQLAKQAPEKVYLLAPTRAEMEQVKGLCAGHPGEIPVYVQIQNEKIMLLLAREYWCDGRKTAVPALLEAFGPQGVVVKEG